MANDGRGLIPTINPEDLTDKSLFRLNKLFRLLASRILSAENQIGETRAEVRQQARSIGSAIGRTGGAPSTGANRFPRVQYFRLGRKPEGYVDSTLTDDGTYTPGANWENAPYYDVTADTLNWDYEGFLPAGVDFQHFKGFKIYIKVGNSYSPATGLNDVFIAAPPEANGYFFDTIRINRNDLPAAAETWEFIATTVNEDDEEEVDASENPVGPGPTAPNTGTTYPEFTVGPVVGVAGREYAPLVTNQAAQFNFDTSESGDQLFNISGSWTNPTGDPRFKGVVVVARIDANPANDRILGILDEDVTTIHTDFWPIGFDPENWVVYFVSQDGAGRRNSIVGGVTPSVNLGTLSRQSGGSGAEYAPVVLNFLAAAYYELDEGGRELFRFYGQWDLPANLSRFRGVKVVARPPTYPTDRDHILAVETEGATTFRTDAWPVPDTSEAWTIYAVSIDANNRANTIQGGTTPSASVTVQRQGWTATPGIEHAPLVAAFSASVEYEIAESGDELFRFKGSWNNPVSSARFRGVDIIARPPTHPTDKDAFLARETEEATTFRTDAWPVPDTSENWTIYAVSIDPSNRRNTIQGGTTPSASVTVQRQGNSATPGLEYAPVVTGFTASATVEYDELGSQMFFFSGSWSNPASTRFRGVKLVARPSGGDGTTDHILAIETEGSTRFRTDKWPAPAANETWTIYAVSIDANNRANTIQGGTTPSASVTVTLLTAAGKADRIKTGTITGPHWALTENGIVTKVTHESTLDGNAGFWVYNSNLTLPVFIAPGLITIRETTSGNTKFNLTGSGDSVMTLYSSAASERVRLNANSAGGLVTLRDGTGIRAQLGASGGGALDLINTSGTTKITADAANGTITLNPSALPTAAAGMIIIDSGDSNKLKWYNGSSWQTAGGSSGLGDPGGNGIVVRTALNTTTNRSIASGNSNYISISNGDGVSGNPTISIGSNVLLTDSNKTLSAVLTVSGTVDFEGSSGTLKIQQKADSAGVPAGANNELFCYFDTVASKLRLVATDSFGSEGYVDLT